MSELKITKGTWELFQNERRVEIKVNNNSIFAINPIIEEYEENAKLILNAPKLYEALFDLVRFCKENEVGAKLEFAEETLKKCIK